MSKFILAAAFTGIFLTAISCAVTPLPVAGTNFVAQCEAVCDPRPVLYVDFTANPSVCYCK